MSDIEPENSKGHSHILPSGQEVYFGELQEFDSSGFSYESKWGPNTEAVVEIADMCNVTFSLDFDEPGNGLFGRVKYKNKELTYYQLSADDLKIVEKIDHETSTTVHYDGEEWNNETELKKEY
jgi:hypothetical protein